ncbi:Dehydration-responsive element-binding protein 1D-like protein [Drosera capensis]
MLQMPQNPFMEMYSCNSQNSVTTTYGSSPFQDESSEASWSSCSSQNSQISDDEVILASNCPKKRAGRKKFKETRHPVYRGVRRRNGDKWVCELRAPSNKSRIWLGTYPTAEMAARAHDVAVLALRGRLACLNFADSATLLPVPASMSIRDIQKAAAEAAELFRPQESWEVSEDNSGHENIVSNPEEVSMCKKLIQIEEFLMDDIVYADEEFTFDMPRLLDSMAEGLLLPPPQYLNTEERDHECEFSLWDYSF